MKKSISIVLSLLMVFSCFTCLLTSTAQAASVSTWAELWHQDYESSTVGDNLKVSQEAAKTGALPSAEKPGLEWGVNAAAGYFNYASANAIDATKFNYRNNTMTVTDAGAASGEKSVAIMAGMFAFSTSLGNLASNTNYKVAVKLKGYSEIAELSSPAIYVAKTLFQNNLANDLEKQQSVCLKDSAGNYARIQNYTYKTDSFDTVELEFNSGDCETAYLVLAFNEGPTGEAGKNLWVDDLSLSTLKDVEVNDINAIGTFEGIKSGTSLKVTSNTAYPKNGEWGGNKNDGYFGALGPDVILPDGTVTQKYDYEFYNKYYPGDSNVAKWNGSLPSTPSSVTDGITAAVTNEAKRSGNQSLKLAFNWWTAAMGLDVEKNTDYEFSFYWLAAEKSKDVLLKSAGIVSDLNAFRLSDFKWATDVVASYAVTLTVKGVNSAGSTSEWQKVTLSFNSGSLNKVYFVLSNNADKVIYLDDLNLKNTAASATENYSVKVVDVSGNKLNSGYGETPTLNKTENEGNADTQVEVVATNTNQKLTFKGWSADDGATFVSTSESYEHALANRDLVAVYSYSENVLGDFEAYDEGACLDAASRTVIPTANGVVGANKNAGYYGALVNGTRTDIYNNVETVTASGTVDGNTAKAAVIKKEEKGNKYLLVGNGYNGWGRFITLAVQPNTNYKLSFKYRDSGAGTMRGIFVTTTVNILNLVTSEESKYTLAKKGFKDRTELVTDWTELTFNFNSGNLSTVYLVFGDNGQGAPNGNRTTDVDDLYLTSIADDSITTFGGASIRTTGNPALRFKSTIDVAAIETATGATVSEFGFTAIRSDYLDTAALVKDGVYGSKKAVTGVAYQAGGEDNKILEQDGNKYTFRAALYNIGVNKDGSKFDYSILGKEFSVRTYVVLQHNGGTLEVLYGETQSYSIFEVAKFLEDNQTTYESDWNAVNSYLNAADQTADINTVANRAAAYAAWKENVNGYTGDIDQ